MADIKMNLVVSEKGGKVLTGTTQKLRQTETAAQKARSAMIAQAKAMAGVVIGYQALTAVTTGALSAQAQQVDAINSLNLALANQGNLLPGTSESLQRYASALQDASTFGDEVILKAQALAAGFGMNEEQIRSTTQAALDFASATGRDLTSAINLLGKAFVGETGELSRYGIIIDKNIPKSEKFAAVIEQVTDRFGGAAQAATKNFSGQMQQLGNTTGDTQESIGKFLGELLNMGPGISGVIQLMEGISFTFSNTFVQALAHARALFLELVAAILGGTVTLAGEFSRFIETIQRTLTAAKDLPGFFADEGIDRDVAALEDLQQELANVASKAEKAKGKALATAVEFRREGSIAAHSAGQTQDFSNALSNAGDTAVDTADEVAAVAEAIEQISINARALAAGGFILPDVSDVGPGAPTEGLNVSLEESNAAAQDLWDRLNEVGDKTEEVADETRSWREELERVVGTAFAIEGIFDTLSNTLSDLGAEGASNLAASLGDIAGGVGDLGASFAAFSTGNILAGIQSGLSGLGGIASGISGFLASPVEEVNDLRDAFLEAQGGWLAYQHQLAAATDEDLLAAIFDAATVEEFDAAVLAATNALNEHAAAQALMGEAQNALQEAVDRYGFTIEQLGPTMQRQMLNEQATQLLQDFELLIASGMSMENVLGGMDEAINQYVQDSLAAGQAIPESMQPMIEQMIAAGLLVDEQGNAFGSAEEAGISFTQSLEEGLGDAVDAIMALVAALTGIDPVTIPVTVSYSDPGFPGGPGGGPGRSSGPPGLAAGGRVDEPTVALVGEAGPEIVAPVEAHFARVTRPILAKLDSMQGAGTAASGVSVTVNAEIHVGGVSGSDGVQMGRDIARGLEDELIPTLTEAIGDISERRAEGS